MSTTICDMAQWLAKIWKKCMFLEVILFVEKVINFNQLSFYAFHNGGVRMKTWSMEWRKNFKKTPIFLTFEVLYYNHVYTHRRQTRGQSCTCCFFGSCSLVLVNKYRILLNKSRIPILHPHFSGPFGANAYTEYWLLYFSIFSSSGH